jgi:hypothetical protein
MSIESIPSFVRPYDGHSWTDCYGHSWFYVLFSIQKQGCNMATQDDFDATVGMKKKMTGLKYGNK